MISGGQRKRKGREGLEKTRGRGTDTYSRLEAGRRMLHAGRCRLDVGGFSRVDHSLPPPHLLEPIIVIAVVIASSTCPHLTPNGIAVLLQLRTIAVVSIAGATTPPSHSFFILE